MNAQNGEEMNLSAAHGDARLLRRAAQAAAIIVEDAPQEAVEGESGQVHGGATQDDAVLLPMNTKIYGKVTKDNIYAWYAFTTSSEPEGTYYILTLNKTGNYDLTTHIYDAYGEQLNSKFAETEGVVSTMVVKDLKPNATYYLRLNPKYEEKYNIDFLIRIVNPNEQNTGYSTANSVTEARGAAAASDGMIYPGTNQDDAGFIPLNVKIGGTVQKESMWTWFAFTTNEVEDATYYITTLNKSGNYDLATHIYNEYGDDLISKYAETNGVASTISIDTLKPNTTYYIRLNPKYGEEYTIDYTLSIEAPEPPAPEPVQVEGLGTVEPVATLEPEPLVFEVPFELGETQVMFKAESDEFVNPEAVEAALKPVADIILEHPDHPILLAGTTATDGDQANRVELSNRRAAAVKRVLVETFGVSEDQLLTVGLGYAADPFVRGIDRNPAGDPSGKFIETEGAKNRRVVVMDAQDPIAKQILGE